MFTGIIESIGEIISVKERNGVFDYTISSPVSSQLKADQSVSHNGVCLTVTSVEKDMHTVTAVDETIQKTNLKYWKVGEYINLERAMILGDRLDGHIVQGHVDGKGVCKNIITQEDNRIFQFEFDPAFASLIIEKGSVCINGVSLTAFNVGSNHFSVTIIPFTFSHTTFPYLKEKDFVNLEFDLIGKYLLRKMEVDSDLTQPLRK